MPFLTVADRLLEYEWIDAAGPAKPTLVFLHEGLGSMRQWRDFPLRLAQATGCRALLYSRYGYGQSEVLREAKAGVRFMHREALESLPALLAAPLLGERIVARQWLGVAISFAGVALIGMQGRLLQPSFNVGDLCALASMAMWGSYTVFLRMRRDALDTVEFLTMVCLLGLVFMTPWVIAEFILGVTLKLTAAGAAAVLYSAIGSLLLAYAGWSYVVKRMGAARAGATMHLMPAIAVGLAALFLGEYPVWYHFAGVALILLGVALASLRARGKA